MNSCVSAAAAGLAASALALASMSPAAADPKPTDDSWQTSVCDNGETYGFPVVYHAADPASALLHAPVHVPGSTVVLQPLSFSGTVSFEVDGTIVESFPVELSNQRTTNPRNTITCHTTYAVTADVGLVVRVEGTDVFAIAGH